MDSLRNAYQMSFVKNYINDQFYVHWMAAAIIYILVIVFAISCGRYYQRIMRLLTRGFIDRNGNRWHYQFYGGVNSLGGNIPTGTFDIKRLKKLCRNPSCMGFDTDGNLKRIITHQSEWVPNLGKGMYVKVPGKKTNSPYPAAIYQGSTSLTPTIY